MANLPVIKPIIVVDVGSAKLNLVDWEFEFKYDGYRGMLHKDGQDAYFMSKEYNRMVGFQTLAEDLAKTIKAKKVILDGEIVVLDPLTGHPVYKHMRRKNARYHFIAFDLLYADGKEWWRLPRTERRKGLKQLLKTSDRIFISSSWEGDPKKMARYGHRNNLEGLVAKRKDSIYTQTTRWYRIKNKLYVRTGMKAEAQGKGK